MRLFVTGIIVMCVAAVLTFAILLNCTKHEPKQLQCYTVEYLHVSGSKMETTLQLTELEKERLHAGQDQGSYFLTVTAPGKGSYRSDVRVNGATALLSITPCQ